MGWNDRLDYQGDGEITTTTDELDEDRWMCENCGSTFPMSNEDYKIIVGSHGRRECLHCVEEFYKMNPDLLMDDDGKPFC